MRRGLFPSSTGNVGIGACGCSKTTRMAGAWLSTLLLKVSPGHPGGLGKASDQSWLTQVLFAGILQGRRCAGLQWSSNPLSSWPQCHAHLGRSGWKLVSPRAPFSSWRPGARLPLRFPASTAICPPEPFSHPDARSGLFLQTPFSLMYFSFFTQLSGTPGP